MLARGAGTIVDVASMAALAPTPGMTFYNAAKAGLAAASESLRGGFALTHPSVHTTLAGPKDDVELEEAMAALDRGPLDPEELAWMKRVGLAVRGDSKAHRAVEQIDRARSFLTGGGQRGPGQAASRDASPPEG